jgi:hypothetical protein
VNDELERMWKEAVLALFKVLCLEGLRKTKKTSVRVGRDLNLGLPEYKTEALTTQPRHSISALFFVCHEYKMLCIRKHEILVRQLHHKNLLKKTDNNYFSG